MTINPKKYSKSDSGTAEWYTLQISNLIDFKEKNHVPLKETKQIIQQKLNDHELKIELLSLLDSGFGIAESIKDILRVSALYADKLKESRLTKDLQSDLESTGGAAIRNAISAWIHKTRLTLERRSKNETSTQLTDIDKSERYSLDTKESSPSTYFEELGRYIDTVEIIIKELEEAENKSPSITVNSIDSSQFVEAEVKLTGNIVTLWLSNGGSIPIKSLRTDGPQYNFINYLLAHPNTNISRGDVRLKIDGCNDIDDLTEIVRYCGFDKQLKRLFFEHCTQLRVQLKPITKVPGLEAAQIIKKYKS